jgi:hypothetical protein
MNAKIVESVILVIMIALGALCMTDTPEPVISFQKDYLGNSGYPRIVCTLLILSCLVHIARALIGKSGRGEQKSGLRLFLPLLLAVLYITGITSLGFCVSTVLFIFFFSLLGAPPTRRRITSGALVALSVTAVVYAAFKIFKVYLPDALWF